MTPEGAVIAAFIPLIVAAVIVLIVHRYVARCKKHAQEMIAKREFLYDVDHVMAVLVFCRRYDLECHYLWARLKEIQEGMIIKKLKEAATGLWK